MGKKELIKMALAVAALLAGVKIGQDVANRLRLNTLVP